MPSRWMLRESAHIESVPAHLSVSCYCLTLAPAPTRRRGQHYGEVPGPPDAPSKMVKRRSVKTVVVPTTVEKVVPIVREVPNKTTRKTKLTGTRMVPRHGHKTITEHEVQVKEEVVHGYRTVWRQVKEPCTHVIKRPTVVPVTRKVAHTWYEPEEYTYEGAPGQPLPQALCSFYLSSFGPF